jgi:two-component system OmpR family sensor kinase
MSIQRRLLFWLLAVLVGGAAATGAIVYREAREEANVLFDYQLKQVAQSLPSQAFRGLTTPHSGLPGVEDGVVVQIWSLQGERLYLSHPDAHLPGRAELGFATTHTDGGDWRVYSALYEDVVIQVAQPMRVRRELAAAVALRTVLPLLLVLPVLGVLIWYTVGRGMRPVRQVAREVGQRSPQALDPLPEKGLPDEIRPVVAALNGLLSRLDRALASQRDFIADAAHELRSPLTALQLQVQLAERAHSEVDRKQSLEAVRAGLTRAAHLVEQLLALARVEPEAGPLKTEAVDLGELARSVVAEFTPLALERNIDLGVVQSDPARIAGDPEALRVLVRNLVDNALRFAPPATRVDVETYKRANQSMLRVTDAGPGIPYAERSRVFDRFYRGSKPGVTGSGLGLAIVRNIVERHAAHITLGDREDGQEGLVVEVGFPEPPAAPELTAERRVALSLP